MADKCYRFCMHCVPLIANICICSFVHFGCVKKNSSNVVLVSKPQSLSKVNSLFTGNGSGLLCFTHTVVVTNTLLATNLGVKGGLHRLPQTGPACQQLGAYPLLLLQSPLQHNVEKISTRPFLFDLLGILYLLPRHTLYWHTKLLKCVFCSITLGFIHSATQFGRLVLGGQPRNGYLEQKSTKDFHH